MRDLPSTASTAAERTPPAARGPGAVYPGTPRWVKVGAIVAAIVVLLVGLAMVLAGAEHGPMRHIPSGSAPIDQSPLAVSLGLA